MKRAVLALPAALLSSLALAALAHEGGPLVAGTPNIAPSWLGPVIAADYDGVTDDLLTAGLGKTGLGSAVPPAVTDPTDPKQLRRLAIYNNYRALVDVSPGGGYGTFYGPNVRADGTVTTDEGRIAGTEYLAFADRGRGRQNVTLMVQVPAGFDPAHACIVTGTSSGSRGVYGAIGTSGEWGLKRGCAVAYADKGTGNGVHDLQNHTINLIDGVRADAATAGDDSNFTARLTDLERQQFNADTPNRFAVKHAHSQQNPEKDWGRDTLRAIEFAFYVLNEKFGTPGPDGKKRRTIVPANTIVIASSASNGAGAALAAAEEDRFGLIDGVAVSEPQIQIDPRRDAVIKRGALTYTGGSKPLYDYFTFANLYQPCAALSTRAAGSPGAVFLIVPFAQNRCASLAAKGLLASTTLAAQAEEALDKLLAYGWEPESAVLHLSHYALATPAIAMTYSNSYGRFSVADNLCGFSFGAVDAAGTPIAAPAAAIATIFGTGNGVPPTGPIQIINNDSVGGPRRDALSISPSTNLQDYNIDGALCQRELWTGANRDRLREALRVRRGIAEVQRTADLNRKPAIIVHGRDDTLVPVNFTSRPYYARNRQVEGRHSKLSYIEVTHAQHFDAFLPIPGFDTRYVPLHVYFNRALDAMYAHLASGAPLPPSQVVRTTPRGGTSPAPALAPANVPAWSANPPASDRITFDGTTLTIPD
jgi:hydroxybutyrate-dimer hydrolase